LGDGNTVEKDQAFLKYMHFILEFQSRNTYIYRYASREIKFVENSCRTTPTRATTL